MTTENGEQKRLQQTLEERGFDVKNLCIKCSLVCPFENAWLAFSASKRILQPNLYARNCDPGGWPQVHVLAYILL